MTRWIQIAGIAMVVIAVLMILHALIARFRHRKSNTCPGPRSWRDWMPWVCLFPHGCNYDLTGLTQTTAGIQCPECGLISQANANRKRRRFRARTAPLAAALLVFGVTCWRLPWIRAGLWAKYTPTYLLIKLDRN